jgi:methyl-accepting chemotaxis protein
MLQYLRTWLADMSVGHKLLLSFGLVSSLSMAAISLAFHAADTLLVGHRQGQAMVDLNLLLLRAHSAEMDYALTRSSESVLHVRQAIALLSQRVGELKLTVGSQLLAPLEKIDSSSRDYLNQFQQFFEQTQAAQQALADMEEQADQARTQFEFVEIDMYDTLRVAISGQGYIDADTLTFAESASVLIRRLLAARVQEFTYIREGDEKYFAVWDDLVQGAEANVSLLLSSIGEEHREVLGTAQQALTDYRKSFEHYRHNRLATKQRALEMQRLATSVLQRADLALAKHQLRLEEQADAIGRLLTVSALVILGLAICACLVIRQLILPPLQRALRLAHDIADGDLSCYLAVNRNDELGQLQQAMGGMSSSLRGVVLRIMQGITQLRLAAEQLQHSSQKSSVGSKIQQHETAQAAIATQQMASSAEAVSLHAEQALLAAQRANKQASAGEHVVRQGGAQICRLAADIEDSMKTIGKLHQGSERIGGVLDVIKAVAERTNLLALNAAIEAARAGEQGRGFAVVADEVRALARRTQDSTREIEVLIDQLQGLSLLAVEQMAGSSRLSQEAVDYSEQALAALTLITSAVGSIEQLNRQIASAAEQQSLVAGEIDRNVDQVRNIAEEGTTYNGRVAESSAELTRVGNQLQQIVQQFRT